MKLFTMFKSRTVWMIIVLFILNGVGGIREQISPSLLSVIDATIAVLGIYFRVNPKQEY